MQKIKRYNKTIIFCFIYFGFIFTQPLQASPPYDSWQVVRQEFKLPHHLDQTAVQQELKWLIQHPKYLQQLIAAKPYLYHIITQIQAQNLPGELALIPMLESAYNPFAYSHAGAAGLWQLMPKTGKHLGVKGSWWNDDRRNITSSTQAALHYFARLHRYFHGDWILAIAAYDCGEGTVSRLINQRQINFWQLPLPNETKHYVPRLLALAEIIAHPEHYGIKLPIIPHQAYFQAIQVPGQIDLNQAAQFAEITYKELIHLNPGFNHWTTSPQQQLVLLLPKDKIQKFKQNLMKNRHRMQTGLIAYQVKTNDNLARIANQNHSNPQFIMKLNHLKTTELHPGQIIHLPKQQQVFLHQPLTKTTKPITILTSRQYKILHIVQNNETLMQLAQQYQIDPRQILTWNHLTSPKLAPGQKLLIWRSTSGLAYYIVKPGDSIKKIAINNQVSMQTLERFNPGLDPLHLQPGQKIKLLQ